MPYYIYRITPPRKLHLIDRKNNFKDAKQLVRSWREQMRKEDDYTIRMIYANSPQEAEKLLSMPREERVIGED